MDNNNTNINIDFKRGDYIGVFYDGEHLTGKVLEVRENGILVDLCLSAKRGDEILMDQVEVPFENISKRKILFKSETLTKKET